MSLFDFPRSSRVHSSFNYVLISSLGYVKTGFILVLKSPRILLIKILLPETFASSD